MQALWGKGKWEVEGLVRGSPDHIDPLRTRSGQLAMPSMSQTQTLPPCMGISCSAKGGVGRDGVSVLHVALPWWYVGETVVCPWSSAAWLSCQCLSMFCSLSSTIRCLRAAWSTWNVRTFYYKSGILWDSHKEYTFSFCFLLFICFAFYLKLIFKNFN